MKETVAAAGIAATILGGSAYVGVKAMHVEAEHQLASAQRIDQCVGRTNGDYIDKAVKFCLEDVDPQDNLAGRPVYYMPEGQPLQKTIAQANTYRQEAAGTHYGRLAEGFGGTALGVSVVALMVMGAASSRGRTAAQARQ